MAAPATTLDGHQLPSYLRRIGFAHHVTAQQLRPSLEHLSKLQWGHLRSIPFENLSLRVDKAKQYPISTNLADIHNKLVLGLRGGYCFEMNGLLGGALRALHYDVYDGGARVAAGKDDKRTSDTFHTNGHDHRLLFVTLDGDMWLSDAGFGGECPPLPIRLPSLADIAGGGQQYWAADEGWAPYAGCDWAQQLPLDRVFQYRLRLALPASTLIPSPAGTPHFEHRAGFYLQKRSSAGTYKDLYFFRLDEFIPQDFAMQDHYMQTHPASPFVCNLMVALHTAAGRTTISNDVLRVFRGGEVEEWHIESEAQLEQVLEEFFGIRL